MSVILSVILTVMGAMSKNESQAATQRMEKQVDDTINRMNDHFERLSGEFLKKPDIDILIKGQIPLDGKRFEIGQGANLGTLYLKNGGNRRTEPISVRLYCSAGCEMQPTGEWLHYVPPDTNYPSAYYLSVFQNTVAAGETWTIEEALTPVILTTATNAN